MSDTNKSTNTEVKEAEGGEFLKVEKQFQSSWGEMVAVLNGEQALKKVKVENDEVGPLVDELMAERKAEAKEQFKVDVSKLLDKYAIFEKEMADAQKDYQKTVIAKRKEFIQAINTALGKVRNVKELANVYRRGLSVAQLGVEAVPVGNIEDAPAKTEE